MSVQGQMDRLSLKFANLAKKQGPSQLQKPLMATDLGPQLFSTVVKNQTQPPFRIWKPRSTFPVESRGQLIRRKLAEIQSKSTAKRPMCIRCGGAGHLARDCRNAQLCFICNKFGHRSMICRTSTSAIPFSPKPTTSQGSRASITSALDNTDLSTHSSPMAPPRRPIHGHHAARGPIQVPPAARGPAPTQAARQPPIAPRQVQIAPQPPLLAPFRPPIHIFTPSPASEAQAREFQQSFIIDDIDGWGPDRIEQALRTLFDQYQWKVAVYDEFKYIVKASSMSWKHNTTRRGFILMEGVQFPVVSWDPSLNAGKRLISLWLRIHGFNKELWEWNEFEKLLNPFGAVVLELDTATRNKYDWRFARVRVGACDPKLFTEQHWQLYRDMTGYVSNFPLKIEVETDSTEPVNAWRGRGPGHRDIDQPRTNPQPPPPLPPQPNSEMDEDLLEDQSEQATGNTSANGCQGETDPRDGHVSDDSDEDHEQFLHKMTQMINNPSQTGACSNTAPKKQKTTPKSGGYQTRSATLHQDAESVPLKPPVLRLEGQSSLHSGKSPMAPPPTADPLDVSPKGKGKFSPTSLPKSPTSYTPTFDCEICYPKIGILPPLGSSSKKQQLGVKNPSKWKKTIKKPPTIPSPAEVIEISDTSYEGPAKPPLHKKGISMRKSLRIQAQADPSSTLTKAKKRARTKDASSSRNPGMPLIDNFPYNRLTLDQVKDLFSVYKIQLGHNADEASSIIHDIQQLNRSIFETFIKDVIDKSKILDTTQNVILATNDVPLKDAPDKGSFEIAKGDEPELFHDSNTTLDTIDSNSSLVGTDLVSS